MSKIIILSDADCDTVLSLLRGLVAELNDDGAGTYRRLAKLFEKAPSEHTIRIIVRYNEVEDVERLPMGFSYKVQDFDKCSECGRLEPLCTWCRLGHLGVP